MPKDYQVFFATLELFVMMTAFLLALKPAVIRTKHLTMCFIWEDDSYFATYQRLAAAVDLGVDHANSFVLPSDWDLRVVYRSSGPSCSHTMYSLVVNVNDLLANGTECHAYMGASCSHSAATLYAFAKQANVPFFALPAGGAWTLQGDTTINDFSLMLQPAFGYSDLADFLLGFLDLFGYQHFALIQDDSYSFYGSCAEPLMRFIRDRNPALHANIFRLGIRSKLMDRDAYKPLLLSANERARVFFLLVHADAVRQLMITAHQAGLTDGQHVFIAMQLYTLDYWGQIDATKRDDFDKMSTEAFRSLLLIRFHQEEASNTRSFEREIRAIARRKYNYTFNPLEPIDPVVVGHYDSIMIYASVLTTLFQSGQDYTDGVLLVKSLTNSSYQGFQGNTIWMGPDRQRDRNYDICYFDRRTGQFEVLVEYVQHSASNETFSFVGQVDWPSADKKLPPDEPKCGYRGTKCVDNNLSPGLLATAVVVPLAFVIVFGVIAAIVLVKLWKIRLAYNPNWWKIPLDDLEIKHTRTGSGSKRTLRSHSTAGPSKTTAFSSVAVEILASYNGILVELIDVHEAGRVPNKTLVEELNTMKAVDNSNLQHLVGIALGPQDVCQYIVAELCSKGSLTDILENEMLKLDWFFKNSLIRDVVFGMAYLRSTHIASHGHLTSFCCLVDTRFTLKISDYGITCFRLPADYLPPRAGDPEGMLHRMLWRAPELLRQTMPPRGTQKGDVYSFAIVLQQIILRSGPFELPNDPLELSDREILQEVIVANIPPVRPRVPRSACSNELYDLMERCWEEIPVERLTFPKIKDRLRKMLGNIGDNIVDLLFKRMEQYAKDLEEKVVQQTQQFMDEKNRSEQLLSQLLPKSVAAALTKGIQVEPEAFESVSIFFSDIVSFTTIAAKGTPMDVVDLLNGLYTFFDNVMEKYDIYKVETIGDAYMVTSAYFGMSVLADRGCLKVSSGLPVRNGNRHAAEVATMALELQTKISTFTVPHRPEERIQVRVGINSGPCVAGIVGLKMPRYCLFGDTVNVASRMESTGEPSKIQIGEQTKSLLESVGGFGVLERGPVQVKGKGTLVTFWLMRKV